MYHSVYTGPRPMRRVPGLGDFSLQNLLTNLTRPVVRTVEQDAGQVVSGVLRQPLVRSAVNDLSTQASQPIANKTLPYIALGVVALLIGGAVLVRSSRRRR